MSVPNSATVSAATSVAYSGMGATTRPISCSNRHASRIAEASTADVLGQHDAQQVGLGQLGPELAVEPLGAGLDLLQAFRRALVGQDLVGQIDDGVLFLGECEIHDGSWSISAARAAC